MSWKSEISAESSGGWASSALRFRTKEEAENYVAFMRDKATRETRVVESTDPTNASFVNGELKAGTT